MINLDKVRKQLDYELKYSFDGEEVFAIKPAMKEKQNFINVIKTIQEDINSTSFTDWLVGLVKQSEEVSEEDLELIRALITDYEGDFLNQTLVGFKIKTQEEVDKAKKQLEEKYLEKNL